MAWPGVAFLIMRTILAMLKHFLPFLLACMVLLISPIAVEAENNGAIYPELFDWDPIDNLADIYMEGQSIAWRSQTPALAGMRSAAAEWGYDHISAGPSNGTVIDEWQGPIVFSNEQKMYGGYAGKLLTGAYAAVGAAFPDSSSYLPFLAASASVEIIIDNDDQGSGSNTLAGLIALAGGITGSYPFPWSVSARTKAGNSIPNDSVEILAEAATRPIFIRRDSSNQEFLRAAIASGMRISTNVGYPIGLIARYTANYEGRKYLGGFAKGIAAASAGSILWEPSAGSLDFSAGISAAAALRFGDKAGLASKIGLEYDSTSMTDWNHAIRLPQAASSLNGDMGLSASIEIPLLFARGNLFMSEKKLVEFFLKPYIEILILRGSGQNLFETGSLIGDGGVELSMTLDDDKTDVLRAGAGFDFSPWMGGSAFPSFSDLEIFLLLSITI
jgi:hypothetical protein